MNDQHAAPVAEPYLGGGETPASWSVAVEELERASPFWLATLHPAGRPHVVPILAVMSHDALHFAAGPGSRKVRNLSHDPRGTVTAHGQVFDLVLEGTVQRVVDDAVLAEVAEVYASRYGWHVEVDEGAVHGDGALTAGPPPYHVFRLVPTTAFGFPVAGDATPTRWTFRRAAGVTRSELEVR